MLLSTIMCVALSACASKHTQSPRDTKPSWSIDIVSGHSPFSTTPIAPRLSPVFSRGDITSPPSSFVADPFLLREGDSWQLFFELFNTETNRGEIGVAESSNLLDWRYRGVALAEPFHLSYPFVFRVGEDIFMLPETKQAGTIRLYRASHYPLQWTLTATLVQGQYTDSSPIHWQGRWWIFACSAPYSLSIFFADKITGPWKPHQHNPIYTNAPDRARPGGRPIIVNNTLYRFVQDNREGYGKRVRAMRVTELSPTRFAEHVAAPDPLLQSGHEGWNQNGMHHFAPIQLPDGSWMAAVDGSGLNPNGHSQRPRD
ncbi:MAG: hypothetical protein RL326_1677 [Pseudomonadota bacterium]